MEQPHISVAIPMLGEAVNLDSLLDCLRRQTCRTFSLYVCVNQPETWHLSNNEWQQSVVSDNLLTLKRLSQVNDINLTIIDRSSKGHGWPDKASGVGQARKALMERIAAEHDDNEIVVSLDADTDFAADYIRQAAGAVGHDGASGALCTPYYHRLAGDQRIDRTLLRYECYMRHYMVNMLEIGSPYAFTALGSAMAFTLKAYRHAGGITPLQGGEDFYLMQKLAKCGRIALLGGTVYPQGRVSRRVPFGTGPAVAMSMDSQAAKYPFYAKKSFQSVKETYDLFPILFERDVETPMSAFLREQLKTDNPWRPLRRNFKNPQLFVRACKERVDGLRILQFVRSLACHEPALLDFANDPIDSLDSYRDHLFAKEMHLRAEAGAVGLS